MNRTATRAVQSCLMVAALLVSFESFAQTDSTETPTQGTSPDRTTLLDTERELHGQVIEAWRRGQGEVVRQYLVQLLDIRRQIYPVDSHPDGHANLLNCMLDLGRVCRDLNRTDDVVKYGQQAREMANRLYPKEDYPNGHPQLAAAMMAGTLGLLLQGALAKGANLLSRSISRLGGPGRVRVCRNGKPPRG